MNVIIFMGQPITEPGGKSKTLTRLRQFHVSLLYAEATSSPTKGIFDGMRFG